MIANLALFFSTAALLISCVVLLMLLKLRKGGEVMRLTNMGNVVSDYMTPAQDDKVITLADNEGVMKFSVRMKNIYYIEADDNYIKVWYDDHTGNVKQYMLRCRLKTVEESFAESDLVRCHRKYIINISRIQVLSKEKDGYQIDLGVDSIGAVPVSKTYEPMVLQKYNSRH